MSHNSIPTIVFDITPDHIQPFFPKRKETVTFAVLVKGSIEELILQGMFQGTIRNYRFEADGKPRDGWQRYRCSLEFPEKKLYFHLVYKDNVRYRYVSQKGHGDYPPAQNDSWLLMFDFQAPRWLGDTVFYQIFPDRFRNGNPDIGVRDGEYQFDGGTSQEVPWKSRPLEWDAGRCIDFYNGDLDGIIQAIPHFKKLGVNALYLNPIFHSRTHHRYDSIDFFSVDPHLGGDEALARLSEALHAEGIKLILDISINHSGSDHPWFVEGKAGGPTREFYYFDDNNEYLAWYGFSTLPQLNYRSEKLRGRMWRDADSVLRKYLKPPYSIDGWRFDVANQTGRNHMDNFSEEIWREVRAAIKEENPQAYVLAEHWDDGSDMLDGDHWDAIMNYFGCGRPIRAWFGEQDRYLTLPAEYPPRKTEPLSNEGFAEFLSQSLRGMPSQARFLQFNVMDTHDISRFHNNPDTYSRENLRAALTVQFMLPGAPVVYYGDEVLLDGHLESCEGVRYPMEWDVELWDRETFDFYRELIELRKNHEALKWGSFKILHKDIHFLVLARYTFKHCVIGVINRSPEARSISIPMDSLPPGLSESDTLTLSLSGYESRLIPQISR